MDEGWVRRIRDGDAEALRELMDAYGDVVLRTASLLLRDRYEAEDVSQEVFLTVYGKIGQLNDPSRLRSWLIQITVNCCRAWMRRGVWKRLFYRDPVDLQILQDTKDSEEKRVEKLLLSDYIRLLPFKYREVIVLYYYQDWTTAYIAEVLGESEGTVKSKLSRARKRLGDMMEDKEWGDR